METCWFCKKNESDSSKSVVVPLYKTVDVDVKIVKSMVRTNTYGTESKMTYVPTKVIVPRCDDCAKTHTRAEWFNILGASFLCLITFLAGFLIINYARTHQGTIFDNNIFVLCCLFPTFFFLLYLSSTLPRIFYLKAKKTLPRSDKKNYPKVRDLISNGYHIGERPGSPSDND